MRRAMLQKINVGFDPDYQAVLDYYTANAIPHPSSFIQIGQNQFMIEMKSYGLLGVSGKYEVYHLFVDGTSVNENAKSVCWQRLVSGTPQHSVQYDTYGIFKDAVANSYFDTNFLFNSGSKYTLNDAYYGYVVYEINSLYLSSADTTRESFAVSSAQKRINSAFTNHSGSAVNLTGQNGFIGISRLDSSNINIYHKSNTYARTQASNSFDAQTFKVNHYNGGGYNNTMSDCHLGSSLTSTDVANHRTAFNNYLTYLGLTTFA